MIDANEPDRPASSEPRPPAESGPGETADTTDDPVPAARWRADTHGETTAGRPVAARRVRRGCLLLVVILLLVCCVLSAWLTDNILDLRAITTGG